MNKFSFSYPSLSDPILAELKALVEIKINPKISDLEKALVIIGYAHKLFKHNGDNQPSSIDPITILKEAKDGSEFRCVEYSLLAVALLWSNKIPSRIIGLKTRDVETREYGAGHVVIEYWDTEKDQWVMCDVQAGIIPIAKDNPLSAFQFRKKIVSKNLLSYIPVKDSRFPSKSFPDMKTYVNWVEEYLYFIDTPKTISFTNLDLSKQKILMLIPKGVKPPVMFQGLFKMNASYTESVSEFYQKPKIDNILIHKDLEVYAFPTQKVFDKWLSKNYQRQEPFWLQIYKKDSNIPTIKIGEAVDVLLCYGWIDGLVNGLDEESYLIRVTPRRPKSVWSKINVAKVERLIADGKMQPSGFVHVKSAKADGRWDKAY